MKNKNKKIVNIKDISFFLIILFIFAKIQVVFATYKTLEKVPGVAQNAGFTGYVTGIYNFAIGFVLIAALLMITIGGFYYITSAGNQAQAGTAKKIITDALLGLIVVFLTYLILNTINPDLMNSSSPNLGKLQQGVQSTAQGGSIPPGTTPQVDTWCAKGGGAAACQKDKATCELLHGEGGCTQSSKVFDGKKAYFVDNGNITEYEDKEACRAAHPNGCVSGNTMKGRYAYGVTNAANIDAIEKGGSVYVSDSAKAHDLSDGDINNIRNFGDKFKSDIANQHDNLNVVGIEKKDNYTAVTVGRFDKDQIISFAKGHDDVSWYKGGQSWGIDDRGNKYYKITKGELKGHVVTTDGKVFLPKNDGSDYTLEDLGLKSNDTATDNDSSDEYDDIAA